MSFAVICTNSQAQYRDFKLRLESKQNRINVLIAGIKPVLDFIDPEPTTPDAYGFGDRPPQPDAIMERCKVALTRFKE